MLVVAFSRGNDSFILDLQVTNKVTQSLFSVVLRPKERRFIKNVSHIDHRRNYERGQSWSSQLILPLHAQNTEVTTVFPPCCVVLSLLTPCCQWTRLRSNGADAPNHHGAAV